MNPGKRLFSLVLGVLIGVTLMVLGFLEIIDAYYSGMGTALVAVLIVRCVKHFRLQHKAEYREKMEVEMKDERNRFLRSRAWAWAGYLYILIAAVASVALRVMGQDVLAIAAGLSVALVVLLYWFAYMLLRKKY